MAIKTKDFRELVDLMKENAASVAPSVEANEVIQKSIQRIESLEGEYLPALNYNDNTILSELQKHTAIMGELLNQILDLNRFMINPEFRNEEIKRQQDLIAAINGLAEKPTPPGKPEVKPEPEPDIPSIIGEIGLAGTLLAGGLGAVAGTVIGYAKYMKTIFTTATSIFDELVLKKIPKVKDSIISSIDFLSDVVTRVKNVIKGDYAKTLEELSTFFTYLKETKIATTLSSAVTSITDFFTPISKALVEIKEASTPIKAVVESIGTKIDNFFGFFTTIGEKLGAFGKIFSATAKIADKIFMPLQIIMAVWDTVEGAMKGYEEGGVMGAIEGAIDGLVTSLVTAPLDLLKDIISWALGKMGFEEAEKALDSFSFTDMWDSFTDWLFSLPEKLSIVINDFIDSIKNFEIPAFNLGIPGIGAIGPWKPFAPEQVVNVEKTPEQAAPKVQKEEGFFSSLVPSFFSEGSSDKTAAVTAGQMEKASAMVVIPAASPQTSAQRVYEGSATNAQAAQPSSAPVVINAPTTTNVNSSKTLVSKVPSRNTDSAVRDYYSSAYSYNR